MENEEFSLLQAQHLPHRWINGLRTLCNVQQRIRHHTILGTSSCDITDNSGKGFLARGSSRAHACWPSVNRTEDGCIISTFHASKGEYKVRNKDI